MIKLTSLVTDFNKLTDKTDLIKNGLTLSDYYGILSAMYDLINNKDTEFMSFKVMQWFKSKNVKIDETVVGWTIKLENIER